MPKARIRKRKKSDKTVARGRIKSKRKIKTKQKRRTPGTRLARK